MPIPKCEELLVEPLITVNGQQLTDAQSMVIRVALASLQSTIVEGALDEHGQIVALLYRERIGEIHRIIFRGEIE